MIDPRENIANQTPGEREAGVDQQGLDRQKQSEASDGAREPITHRHEAGNTESPRNSTDIQANNVHQEQKRQNKLDRDVEAELQREVATVVQDHKMIYTMVSVPLSFVLGIPFVTAAYFMGLEGESAWLFLPLWIAAFIVIRKVLLRRKARSVREELEARNRRLLSPEWLARRSDG